MNESDREKIEALIEQAYKVVVRFVDGKTFTERYDVHQFDGFENLKRVVVSEDGKVLDTSKLPVDVEDD